MSDLSIPTYIQTVKEGDVPLKFEKNVFISNTKYTENITDNVVDAILSSSAIPVVFPTKDIGGNKYYDGGSKTGNIPYPCMFEYTANIEERFDTIYVVTFDVTHKLSYEDELPYLNLKEGNIEELLKVFIKIFETHLSPSDKVFKNNLKTIVDRDQDLKNKIYIYTPKLDKSYPLLDFNNSKEQLDKTDTWARSNEPILYEDYIK